ncbi:MAG: dienelactone hydrolase family protein, partial [Ignavibacteriales bacterium]
MKYFIIFSFLLFVSFNCSEQREEEMNNESPITGEEVTYSSNGTNFKGYLVYDKNIETPQPGVIVVHEWWGHNEYARKRADMLAELGYTALAIDMYGNGKTADHPDDAGKFAMSVMQNIEEAKARFNAGLNFLKNHEQTDSTKTAAIGYCFGGGIVLHMALMGADLDGVVSFHGSLPTDPVQNPEQVNAALLVLNGEADPFVTQEQLDKFEEEIRKTDIGYTIINYPQAKHSFTNPAADTLGEKFNIPLAYNKNADEKSWQEMKEFFKEIF